MALTDTYKLNNGVEIPVVGFGTWQTPDGEVAEAHNHSVPQVLLRWSLQHGFLPLPKSVHAEYIKSNTDIFDFELTDDEMKKLDGLRGVTHLATDPDTATF